MGQQPTRLKVLLLGAQNTGKSRFINLLQFRDDVTYLGPTNGKYAGLYQHRHVLFELEEYGGKHQRIWHKWLSYDAHKRVDALFFFVCIDATETQLQSSYAYVLSLLATYTQLNSTPLVIMVYNQIEMSHAHIDKHLSRIKQALQLKVISDERPVLLTLLSTFDFNQLNNTIQFVFDWVVDKTTIA